MEEKKRRVFYCLGKPTWSQLRWKYLWQFPYHISWVSYSLLVPGAFMLAFSFWIFLSLSFHFLPTDTSVALQLAVNTHKLTIKEIFQCRISTPETSLLWLQHLLQPHCYRPQHTPWPAQSATSTPIFTTSTAFGISFKYSTVSRICLQS